MFCCLLCSWFCKIIRLYIFINISILIISPWYPAGNSALSRKFSSVPCHDKHGKEEKVGQGILQLLGHLVTSGDTGEFTSDISRTFQFCPLRCEPARELGPQMLIGIFLPNVPCFLSILTKRDTLLFVWGKDLIMLFACSQPQ